MNILDISEKLRELAEKKSKENGQTIQEAWKEAVKELDNIFKNEDMKYTK